jgi:hypothetical protein
MTIKLSDYILEQTISDASVDDIMIEQAVAEVEVASAMLEAYFKQVAMYGDGYFQEMNNGKSETEINFLSRRAHVAATSFL